MIQIKYVCTVGVCKIHLTFKGATTWYRALGDTHNCVVCIVMKMEKGGVGAL